MHRDDIFHRLTTIAPSTIIHRATMRDGIQEARGSSHRGKGRSRHQIRATVEMDG